MKKKRDPEVVAVENELKQISKDLKKWIKSCKPLDIEKARAGKAFKKRLAVRGRKIASLKKLKTIPDRVITAMNNEQKQFDKDFKKWKRKHKALDIQKSRECKALFNERYNEVGRKIALLLKKKKLKKQGKRTRKRV